IAIEGYCHGKLDLIYDKLLKIQEREGIKIDLLLCCGDFQAIRDQDDLNCMAVPDKYKEIGSFHKGLWVEHLFPWLWIELDVFD
uniref:Calcineurin-like phosphoesterase domain-containing protein n=1 Tax=Amphimedon queenslandica TaxID=400682 RepID=A0A1X7TN38_AMPQE